jgi:AcrR family transcriptional regulator
LSTSDLSARQLDPLIALLIACLTRTLDDAATLRTAAPEGYPTERIEVAFTDVMHRSLFGPNPFNAHAASPLHPPRVEFGPDVGAMMAKEEAIRSGADKRAALNALVQNGRDVFVQHGYHATRVDDLAAAAGVSHGVFYRYFENKNELAIVLTVQAMRAVGDAFVGIPDPVADNGPELRRWFRRYNAAQTGEAAMIRVWVEAALEDARMRSLSASALDWGRRRLVRVLGARGSGTGDVDVEAVVMVALLGAFGSRPRGAATVDAAANIVERGLLSGVVP